MLLFTGILAVILVFAFTACKNGPDGGITAKFKFTGYASLIGNSTVVFKWPAGVTWPTTQMTAASANKVGDNVTIALEYLLPGTIRVTNLSDTDGGSPEANMDFNLYFAGNTRKLLHGAGGDAIKANDILASYPATQLFWHGAAYDAFVIPFTPVNVPSSANAVRIEIRWDLDNIIEQYRGTDNIANNANDIFVLKNGWWEALSIAGYIE
jgi:hypothetical protein